MALVIEDRVRETTTTSGTGTIALAGAFAGFQPFSVIGNGNTTYYCIIDAANGEWEVGVGTYTASGNTLSRDTVLSSSNLGGLVNFASTTKDVICTQPAERAVYLDSATNATIPGITLSGGTANGVAYLNGSKAITTGSALTFDGSQLDIPLGSAAAPSLSTPTDPNTGIFFPAADTIAFTEGGVESMRLNSSGNLGLGVTPSALWQSGIKAFQIGASGAIHTFGTASSQIIVAANNYYDGTNNVYLNNGFATQYSQTTGVHAWFTSPSGTAGNAVSFTQAMTLNASGNLGLGSIAPVGYAGYVGATIQSTNGGFINIRNTANTNQMEIAVEGGGNTSYVKTVTSMPLTFGTNNIERMRLDASGNLGLGVTPSAWTTFKAIQLGSGSSVAVDSSGAVGQNYYFDGTNYRYVNIGPAALYSFASGQHRWFNASSGTAGNVITLTQAMTLDASGNLGIGTSSPAARLSVRSTGAQVDISTSATQVTFEAIDRAAIANPVDMRFFARNGTFQWHNSSYAERMRLDASGNLGLGVTPSAWANNFKAIEVVGTSIAANGYNNLNIATNVNGAGVDGAGNGGTYATNSPAARYKQISGIHAWYNAPTGTAGNAITFTQAMTLDASGNLGVGTTSPGARLQVLGPVGSLNDSGGTLRLETDAVGTDVLGALGAGMVFAQRWQNASAIVRVAGIYGVKGAGTGNFGGAMAFYTQASGSGADMSERMRLDASGNLGVGTTSPGARLHVGNGRIFLDQDFQLTWQNAGTNRARMYGDSGSNIIFETGSGNTERARITSNGNLSIGTTASGGRLDVRDINRTGNATNQVIYTTTAQAADVGGTLGLGGLWDATSSTMFGTIRGGKENSTSGNYAGYLSFGTVANGASIAERARIDSIGNLGVGTTPLNTGGLMVNVFGAGNGIWSSNSRQLISSSNAYFGSLGWTYAASTFAAAQYSMNNGLHAWLIAPTGTAGNAITFTQAMTLDTSGNLLVGATTAFNGANTIFKGGSTNDLQLTVGGSGSVPGVAIHFGNNTGTANAANSLMKLGTMGVTNRSISSAGTINASGADYAEYMTKAGDFTIAKGDVVGINSEGKLTNVFADAISFCVKSTDPSYVGGDSWGCGLDNDPEALEAARQKVDRIAFAGQVPVNVLGATPGQYIVPVEDGSAIKGVAKNEGDMTISDYMKSVGKVISLQGDGRAFIIVKVA